SCTLCTILQPILWQGVRVATVGEQTHSIVIAHIPSRSRCGWSSLVAAPGPRWEAVWRKIRLILNSIQDFHRVRDDRDSVGPGVLKGGPFDESRCVVLVTPVFEPSRVKRNIGKIFNAITENNIFEI